VADAVGPDRELQPTSGGVGPTTFRGAQSGELIEAVYGQLRVIAQRQMSQERAGHTLQATALVNEAYLRLSQAGVAWSSPGGFYQAAAEAMRRILIDHARARGSAKRGGARTRLPLSVVDLAEDSDPAEILALDSALLRLEGAEPEVAAVVRLRFFAGLSGDETAEALAISPRQVDRLWGYARAWLRREMRQAD
jgi:RNA polymerase sigma factor (TIGR02999 family)